MPTHNSSKNHSTVKRSQLIAPSYSGYQSLEKLDQGLCANPQVFKMDPEIVLVSQDLGNESLTHGGMTSGNNHFTYDKAYNKNCSALNYRKCDGVLKPTGGMRQQIVENYPNLNSMHNMGHSASSNDNNSYPGNGRSWNAVECHRNTAYTLPRRKMPLVVDGNQLHHLGL